MVNKVILVGRLGRDPERKGKVLAFSLATVKKYTVNNELKSITQWHNISVFDKLADLCEAYLRKGSMAYVEGELNYFKKDEITYTSITAREIRFLSDRKEEVAKPPVESNPVLEAMVSDIPF